MNSASMKAPRLKRVIKAFQKYKRLTTRGVITRAHVCAVSAVVSELRDNGYNITCKRTGNKWMYTYYGKIRSRSWEVYDEIGKLRKEK